MSHRESVRWLPLPAAVLIGLCLACTAALADTPAQLSPKAVVTAFSHLIESHQALEGVDRYVASDFVEHDPAVPHQQQAVEVFGLSKVEQFGEFGRIHALLFRRGSLPLPGRPGGLPGALRRCGTAAAVTRYVGRRFRRNCSSNSSTGVSCTRPPIANPPTRLTTPRNGAAPAPTACATTLSWRVTRQ